MKRRVLVIRNPAAGGGGHDSAARAETLLRELRAAGHCVSEMVTRTADEARGWAAAHSGDRDVVVAAGGDGTAHEVANGLLAARGTAALAVAPFGTGNDFARLLGTVTPADTVRAVTEAQPALIDTFEVTFLRQPESARRFGLLFVACGIATPLLQATTPGLKRLLGRRWCYMAGFLRALGGYRPLSIRVRSAAGEWEDSSATVLAVAKGRHAGGAVLQLAPAARYTDGTLHGVWLGRASRGAVLGHFARLRQGIHGRHPAVRCFTTDWLEITTDPPQALALDGEVIGSTPARIEVRPASLRVLGLAPL